uniref:Collagen IV NC1 domain-containing protein n=2 Tax=Amphimedon queenslandica TaxID=400682 RepID=A0A1X7T0X2_AMPQE
MNLIMVLVPILTTLSIIVSTNENTIKGPSSVSTNKRYINETNVKEVYLQILRGRDGRDGLTGRDGVKGERGDKGERGEKGETGPIGKTCTKCGGVVYTRWGRKSCPTGAELLYEGITGGSYYDHPGGGANYVCLPKVPQYMSTTYKHTNLANYMYGTEYEWTNGIFPGTDQHNVPCAVCYTSTKSVKLMIPARTSCPSSWTMEYKGYLMAERSSHHAKSVYECVDESAESINGSQANVNGATIFFTLSTCNGLPCPPYVNNVPITCVVCTK